MRSARRRPAFALAASTLAFRTALLPPAFAQKPTAQPPVERSPERTTVVHALGEPSEAQVHFVSEQGSLNLSMREEDEFGQEHFDPICTAPCETTLPTGRHRMALSLGGQPPLGLPHMSRGAVEIGKPVVLLGPSTLKGTYRSRESLRLSLWVFACAVGIGGGAFLDAGVNHTESACTGDPSSCTSYWKPDWGMIIAGTILDGAALALGIAPFFIHDSATIDVDISSIPLVSPKRFAMEDASFPNAGHGASVRVKF